MSAARSRRRLAGWLLGAALLLSRAVLGDSLPDVYWQAWRTEVNVLLSPAERTAFDGLADDTERWAFRREMWRSRDPVPATPQNEWRDEWDDRVRWALGEFDDLAGEGPQLVLAFGPPAVVDRVSCGGLRLRFLQWKVGDSVAGLLFEADSDGAWRRGDVEEAKRMLHARGCSTQATRLGYLPTTLPDLNEALAEADVPRPGDDWLAAFRRDLAQAESVWLPEAPFDASFGDRYDDGIALRLALHVPEPPGLAAAVADRRIPTLLLQAELVAGDRVTPVRERFFLPSPSDLDSFELAASRVVPTPARRSLLVVELCEEGGGVLFRGRRELDPPSGARHGREEDRPRALTSNVAALVATPRVRLRPLPGAVVGRLPVEADVTGAGVVRVDFLLDGQEVARVEEAPYATEIWFGSSPRHRRLEAVAHDAGDRVVARTAQDVNVVAAPFRVDVHLPPRKGSRQRVVAEVVGREPAEVSRVEIFAEEEPLTALDAPPFETSIDLAERHVSWVRAIAWLEDGSHEETVALVDVPGQVENLEVEVIELYASVLDPQGAAVRGLDLDDFRVREDGVPQKVLEVDAVESIALDVAVLVDSSGSMGDGMPAARESALRFFRSVLGDDDEAALFAFNEEPRLIVPLTGDLARLEEGLASVTTWGGTALWDSIGLALHYLHPSEDRRAIIVLTDGLDEDSATRYTDLLASAMRSGTPIFLISIVTAGEEADPRLLERLATATGGAYFRVKTLRRLGEVYDRIREQLLSQYRISYQTTGHGRGFRRVEISMTRPGLEARASRGYFP